MPASNSKDDEEGHGSLVASSSKLSSSTHQANASRSASFMSTDPTVSSLYNIDMDDQYYQRHPHQQGFHLIVAYVSFHYPYTLWAIHMFVSIIGANIYLRCCGKDVRRKKLSDPRGLQRFILFFSPIFVANILLGNISLRYVSVSFNQVMRSLVPAVCMVLEYVWKKRVHSIGKRQAVLPVVFGVALACYRELEFTLLGFIVTGLYVLAPAVKVVVSRQALAGKFELTPVDLLARMAPLALLQFLILTYL